MAQDRIEREIVIEAPRERVWAVLTQAEHVAQWFGDSAEIDLQPGGKAAFGWSEHGRHEAIVERVEPPDFFSYRWARKTDTAPGAGEATLVEFTLSNHGNGTLLRVVETGFASLNVTEEERSKASEENTQGWKSELAELKEYAEQPAA
ncbi:MAG TPA: SRPBCC family protein [Streptosporangiaceae bacterium]